MLTVQCESRLKFGGREKNWIFVCFAAFPSFPSPASNGLVRLSRFVKDSELRLKHSETHERKTMGNYQAKTLSLQHSEYIQSKTTARIRAAVGQCASTLNSSRF